MGSLYIGGGQVVHAEFKQEDDWEIFDNKQRELIKLAKSFDVNVDRYSLDEDGYSFVISNEPIHHECFYAGAAFNIDMTVETSKTFQERAQKFISALEAKPEFDTFHGLQWSKPEVLYFVTS